jgi:hypothetical protein
MAITTYDELKAAVADFLNRDDLATSAATFISLAEAGMQRSLRHWRMEKRANAVIDTQYSAIPADFLQVIRFHITSGTTRPLELISQSELLERKANTSNTLGGPSYYAMTAGEIEVFPVPDGDYDAELHYYSEVPALSAANPTNWVLEYFPDLYLYGALVHSAPYLKEDERTQVWAALYRSAIDAINEDSERGKFGGSGRRLKIRSY